MDWTELKANVATWLGRRTDLAAEIITCVGMAEAEFNRELRVPEMEAGDTDTMSSGVLTLPSDFLGMKSVYLTYDYAGEAVKVALSQVSLQQMRADYPFEPPTIRSVPSVYATSAGTLIFGPPPDDDYEVTFTYYAAIPALGDSNTTNWLLECHPDLYMAAAQWHANVILKAWDEVAYFRGETERLIAAVNRAGVKKAIAGPAVQIPSPVRNLYLPGVRA